MSPAPQQTPFERDNATHPDFQESSYDDYVRITLQNERRQRGAAWPQATNTSIPKRCYAVQAAHAPNQKRVFELLQDVIAGKYDRPRLGGMAPIKGVLRGKSKEDGGTAYVSIGWMARLLMLPYGTVRYAIKNLILKRSIVLGPEVATRKAGAHDAATYIVPTYTEILAARQVDANIATTHGNWNWTTSRRDSLRFLTPDEAEKVWRIPHIIKRRAVELKAAAGVSSDSAAAPPAAADPRRQRRGISISEELQNGLDVLMGRGRSIGGADAIALAEMLRFRARKHEKLLDDEMVVRACQYHLERKFGATPHNQWRGIGKPVNWVITQIEIDFDDVKLLNAHDDVLAKRLRDENDLRHKMEELFDTRRQHIAQGLPLSESDRAFGFTLEQQNPALWKKLLASTHTDWNWKPAKPPKQTHAETETWKPPPAIEDIAAGKWNGDDS